MTTLYPTALDALTNPVGTDSQNVISHASQHANANDAIEALQAKVGVNIAGLANTVTRTIQSKVTDVICVRDWGAIGGGTIDDTVAIQNAINAMVYNQTTGDFDAVLDFGGKVYKVTASINLTNLRSPGLTIRNGGLLGACAGKVVLDLSGSTTITINDFIVYGSATAMPSVGILLARCENNPPGSGVYPAASNHKWSNVTTEGYFTKSGVINFASEVSGMSMCRIFNRHRALAATAYALVDHYSVLQDQYGGLSSDFVTIPNAAAGTKSCILHYLDQVHIQRPSAYALPITSISQTNPAVVTLTAGDVAANSIANGDKLFFGDVTGMTQLNGNVYTVAGVAGDTFQLSGINATGFGAFGAGTLRNQTGPAVLLSGCGGVTGKAGYILTYGNDAIRVDTQYGAGMNHVDLEFQHENSPINCITFQLPAAGMKFCTGLRLRLLNQNQNVRDSFITATTAGTGQLTMRNFQLDIANQSNDPTNHLFGAPSLFFLKNMDLYIPLAATLNASSLFGATPTGVAYTVDDGVNHEFGGVKRMEAQAAGMVAGIVYCSDDGAAEGPFFDIQRDSASPAASDILGKLRFIGRNSAAAVKTYGSIRPQIVDATAGSEDGRLQLLAMVAGVETVLAEFENGMFNFFTSFTVANLPAGAAKKIAFATNGRKNGEGAGSGTGVLVFHDGTAWRACDTGATVAA